MHLKLQIKLFIDFLHHFIRSTKLPFLASFPQNYVRSLMIISFLILISCPFNGYAIFIAKRESLKNYEKRPDVVFIASTGRSGSTMLTRQFKKYISASRVLKTHLLPPSANFLGKIIFIFSNPDQAAESALYMTLHREGFGKRHFTFVETADRGWLRRIGDARNQTEQDNLLAYDALGIYEHLKIWLHTRTRPVTPQNAQILAIKYEHLWDKSTIKAIRTFLDIDDFKLPPKRPRGHKEEDLLTQEITFKKMYNLGTSTNPSYAAYADAKILWEEAPPFQFLQIINAHD
jgi:hypothetical protein